ncbi:uncharacterized protein LOC122048471 [Zingiber officinale]|uniref:Uncharacterized protein n=1 Tax=Zingiber officinale TaxID=94328 RepID=A0A8J5HC99_ZINOF|nr:uncharacterized protein LOC122048471 [Zingiber officinale]KAG6524916.1 hypothetical protein ZIOFF_014861 [Zingiber officinale]
MAWFFSDSRGPHWKRGWQEQTLCSLSLPPLHLILVFAIVVLFLCMSWYHDYKTQMIRTEIGLRFFTFLLPVALLVVAPFFLRQMFVFPGRRREQESPAAQGAGASPVKVLALVLVLLLMISYQSSFSWFKPIWRME